MPGSWLEALTAHELIRACADLEIDGPIADSTTAAMHTLRSLASRWLGLHEEIELHTAHLKALITQAAPNLVAAFGIGFEGAAELLITAGDNTDRVRSEAAFAKFCGACPIPAGSGCTDGRHRLNRGGNHQANASLHRIVIVRMCWHPPTMSYVARRTLRGTNQERHHPLPQTPRRPEIYDLLPTPATTELAT